MAFNPLRRLTRRSFLGRVAGGAAAAGGAFGLVGGQASAQQALRGFSGVTDNDAGPSSDSGCEGRGGPGSRICRPATQLSDGDPLDPAGDGWGGVRDGGVRPASGQLTGITDNDTGARSDPVNQGRGGGSSRSGRTGLTDNDTGRSADPVGYGRGGRGRRACTDYDTGNITDPIGRGRNC